MTTIHETQRKEREGMNGGRESIKQLKRQNTSTLKTQMILDHRLKATVVMNWPKTSLGNMCSQRSKVDKRLSGWVNKNAPVRIRLLPGSHWVSKIWTEKQKLYFKQEGWRNGMRYSETFESHSQGLWNMTEKIGCGGEVGMEKGEFLVSSSLKPLFLICIQSKELSHLVLIFKQLCLNCLLPVLN